MVKNKKAYRVLHFILSILLVFYSVVPGLTFLKPSSIYAQEATLQDSTPSATEPTITPTPTDDPQLTPTATLTPIPEVTPVPAETTPTPTPQTENIGQPNAPPADGQTPAPESSPTAEPPPSGAPSIETVRGDLSIDSIENLNLEPIEVNSASLITDKADYAPTDIAVTTGSGFPKEDEIRLIITADDYHFETFVTTDSEGTFIYAYQLDGKYRPLYKVEARDLSGQILATTTFTDAAPLGKDFDQCANQDPTLGECNWIGSVLQNNNSEYNEGMSVPQRVLFTNIPATSGNVHTLTFDHQSTKGGNHAYDFLTAYNQGNSPPITLNPCDDLGGDTLTCNSLRGGANNLLVDVPDDPYVSKDGSTQSRLDAYEALYGNRQIKIYGGSSITSASFSSISHDVADGADTGDSDISYTLTWTSASSNILIEMAGHISLGVDPAINPIGWGSGLGAGSVSGGPYHFKLDQLDGSAVGAQDNQIQAGAVILPGTVTIIKNTDPDDAQNFNFSTNGSGLSSFSLDDDSDSILSNTKTFTGLAPGSFAVTEATSAEFTLSNLSCVDPTGNTTVNGPTADINLAAGETVTCTFTNVRNGGSVKVHKFVDTDGNGTFEETSDNNANGLGFRWSLDGASPTTEFGTEVSGVTALSHAVNENSLTDYRFVSWFINGGQGSCTNPDGTSLPASITVNSNQRTEITLCNARKTGTLTINKILDPASDPGLFNLQIDSSTAGTGANVGNGGTTGPSTVTTGSHNVGESAGSSTSLSDYTSSISCTNGQTGQGTSLAVSIGDGENIICTITNTTKRGRIVIVKDAISNNTQDFTFHNDFGNSNPETFVLDDDGPSGSSTPNTRDFEVLPGTFSVSEDPVTGWQQESASCSDGSPISDIVVSPGETVTCTFVNEELAEIILVKDTVGGDGTFDFAMTGQGLPGSTQLTTVGNSASQTFSDLDQDNTYTIAETVPSGWDLASASCTGTNTPESITPNPGETVTCTFTNTKRGSITIAKDANPDHFQDFSYTTTGLGLSSFDLDDDGESGNELSNSRTFDNLVPGEYSVTEGAVLDWDLTSLSCDTGEATDLGSRQATINLEAGENVTCTFTNTQRGRIIVSKFTDPESSEESFNFTTNYSQGFSLGNGDSNDSGLLLPGVYSVTEDTPVGWDLTSASCSDGSGPSQIDLAPGETVTCDFTNTQRGRVTVTKLTVPSSDTSTEFSFSTDLDDNGDFILVGNGSSEIFTNVEPGNYFLEELVPAGWQLTSAECSGEEEFENGGEINLSPGENIECTFTNTQKGTIIVEKQTDPEGASDNFTFTGDVAGSISDNGQIVVSDLLPGQYTSEESNTTSTFDLTSISCDDSNSVGDIESRTVTFNLEAGETIKCTFTNTKKGHLIVQKTTVPGGELDLFSIQVGGSGTITGNPFGFISDTQNAIFTVTPGTYSVTEDSLTGWDETDNTCQDVEVAAGRASFCEITNTKRGQIIIGKQTVPDGSQQIFEFQPSYGGNFFLSDGQFNHSGLLESGIYSVLENTPSGWRSEISCSDGSSSDNISLDPGERVICTFTNTREEGKILVRKIVDTDGDLETVGDQSPGVRWSFDVNGTSEDTSNPASDLTDENGLVEFDNLKTGEYEVIESLHDGHHLISASCLDEEESEIGEFNGKDRIEGLQVNSNGEINCTFINTRDRGSITIIKNIDNNGDGDTLDEGDVQGATDWFWDILDGDQNIATGQTKSLVTGAYTISEDQQPGYKLLGWSCSNDQTGSTNSIEIEVTRDSQTTCTFENQLQNPVLSISKSNNKTGVDVSPGSQVIYTLTIKVTQSGISGVTVKDLLPDGFAYHTGSWAAVKNGFPFSVPEPTYASPGTWLLGDLADGDIVELTLTADIAGGQEPGLYKDLAWASGTSLASASVLASAENPGFVDGNFVGTDVKVVKGQGSTGFNVEREEQREGEVLGAATAMPETGAQALWMVLVLGLLAGGAGSVFWGVKMRRGDG